MNGITSAPFVRLWVGNTASGLATWALPFVLGFAVLGGQLTSASLGVALAVRTLGFLVAVPISGILSDRSGPRRIIFASGVAGAAGLPIIFVGIFAWEQGASLLLIVGAIIVGIGQGACRPAYQAIIPEIVSIEDLQAANAALSISVRVTSIVGPAVVGLIVLGSGIEIAFLAIAALWLTSALAPPAGRARRGDTGLPSVGKLTFRNLFHDFIEGAGEARRHPWFVTGLVCLTITIAAGYSVTAVLLPGISQEVSGGATLMTATATSYMAGALFGALLMARWRPANRGWVALLGLCFYGLAPLSLLVTEAIVVPLAAYLVAGIGIEMFNVPWFTSIQNEISQNRLSRVSSLDFLFSYGLAPLGLTLMSPLTEALGQEVVLIGTGLLCLVAPAVAMCLPTARYFSRKPQT
ncbi:MFS transporter (plasmid) [Rhizobium leguminosarum]|uniref:MFS transporter n=1 Tax=Rhizobium leguminosarum TaxID=384 RepID=UPI0010321BA6|nr:MFS transporter [Rhizobium leguminosarum]TAZ47103.1 MFS transporter [Rhizobium leguminosarum]